jgi:hypothetical protein
MDADAVSAVNTSMAFRSLSVTFVSAGGSTVMVGLRLRDCG